MSLMSIIVMMLAGPPHYRVSSTADSIHTLTQQLKAVDIRRKENAIDNKLIIFSKNKNIQQHSIVILVDVVDFGKRQTFIKSN